METNIISTCAIKDNKVWLNGTLQEKEPADTDLSSFLGGLYKSHQLNYPKFFKMDRLCKLGLLATELLIRNTPGFEEISKPEIALVFSNRAASLDTDRNHAAAIADKNNYFPSPSVFVYTLPNIITGEIAIKHKITGENAFFVCETFNAELIHRYTSALLAEKAGQAAICGWIDVDGNKYSAFVYCVKKANFKQEKTGFHEAHNPQTIHHLYSL